MRLIYCGEELRQYKWHVDHLLPAGKYPELNWWREGYRVRTILTGNAVPCCHDCNVAKGRWDPNTDEGGSIYDKNRDDCVLGPNQREELISRAREHVEEKLARRRWYFAARSGA